MMMMMISTWIKLASKRSFGLQTLERKREKFATLFVSICQMEISSNNM